MIYFVRAGPPSRPCASFIKLAQHRARRSGPIVAALKQWRSYVTEPSHQEVDRPQEARSLSSQFLCKLDYGIVSDVLQKRRELAIMK